MKHSWLFIFPAAAIMTGCTGMMYGKTMAPVTRQNTVYGKPLQLHATAADDSSGEPHRRTVPNPASRKPTTPPRRPGGEPLPRIEAVESSPYQASGWDPRGATIEANDDGWSIRPQTGAEGSDGVAETPEDAMENTEHTALQPIRPPESVRAIAAQSGAVAPAEPDRTSAPQDAVVSAAVSGTAGRADSSQSAVDTLINRANAAIGKGDLDGAAAYLEDAQRIDGKNSKSAKILYDIANIRYHQGKYREAEAAASRAVRVGGDNETMQKTWSLIANSRKALGDNQGAITAAEKAASL